jgi:hypothetical protein
VTIEQWIAGAVTVLGEWVHLMVTAPAFILVLIGAYYAVK